MKGFCLFFVFFLVVSATAQDLKKDLLGMNAYLNQLSHFRIEVVYAGGDTTDLKQEEMVSVYVCPEGLFYSMVSSSIVINEKNTILVNDEDHTLIYSNNEEAKKHKRKFDVQKQLLKGIDTLIDRADSIYFSANDTSKTYYIRSKNSYFNLLEVEFKGIVVSKVTYYYNSEYTQQQEGLKAVNKLSIIENPVFDPKLVKTDTYYTIENGSAQPTEEFKNHILIYNESSEEFFE